MKPPFVDKAVFDKTVGDLYNPLSSDISNVFYKLNKSQVNKIMTNMGVKAPHFYTTDQQIQWMLGSFEDRVEIQNQIALKLKETGAKTAAKLKGQTKIKADPTGKIETTPVHQTFTQTIGTADESWATTKAKLLELDKTGKIKLENANNIGGMHTKYFVTDDQGVKWLFKPYSREAFRAEADEMAYKVGRMIDPESIEVRAINLAGKPGSIQRWMTGVQSISDDVVKYTPEQIKFLQREHVTDWLVGNHDAHGEQFIFKGNQFWGIDKGQAGKFIGKEKLSVNFHPNADFGTRPPVYNELYKAA